jgi:hypothetical protein
MDGSWLIVGGCPDLPDPGGVGRGRELARDLFLATGVVAAGAVIEAGVYVGLAVTRSASVTRMEFGQRVAGVGRGEQMAG